MSAENQLYFSIGYCVFMLVLALVVRKYPPKRINHFYGYRTNLSMKNQEIWDEANRYSSDVMLKMCLYSFLVPGLCYFLFPEFNLLITIVINTILIILVMYYTEKYLKAHFDSDGNRKNSSSDMNP